MSGGLVANTGASVAVGVAGKGISAGRPSVGGGSGAAVVGLATARDGGILALVYELSRKELVSWEQRYGQKILIKEIHLGVGDKIPGRIGTRPSSRHCG